ncbi:ribonucleases G and E [Zymobacter palmae]|uniref:Ribonucleases G and E n=1 Tax=Zymobacter palmae TaxID=33074 RepID=A0A348HHJ2_9GAMM|nr:ribonucleases G and E [Zymobacter palmae]
MMSVPCCHVSDVFQRAFRQDSDDRILLDGQLGAFGDFDLDVVIDHFGDAAGQTTGKNDFVAFGQLAHQFALCLGTLALRTHDHEVHQDEDGDDRQERNQGAALRCRSRCAIGVSRGNQKIEHGYSSSKVG